MTKKMTKTNKITAILIAVLVVAILATIADIASCIRDGRIFDWSGSTATFAALAVAFSCLTKKKSVDAK